MPCFIAAQCSLREDQQSRITFSTFDQVSFDMPEIADDCEVLLAKDCTSEPLFAVLISKNQESKNLRVLVPNTEIEVSLLSGYRTSTQIRVNGQIQQIREGQKSEISIRSQNKEMIAELSQSGSTVHINVQQLGLRIAINDMHLSIDVST